MTQRRSFILARLPEVCHDLARSHVENMVDASRVMLDKFHVSPSTFQLAWSGMRQLELEWSAPAEAHRQAHANELDATETGAYGLAFVAAHEGGYVVRRRAHHGSGSDYLLSKRGEPDNDFVKLEVSGIARGHGLLGRLRDKIAQLRKGDLRRPGLAIVVGFEAAEICVEEVSL
jgi:hypothetical protein